MTKKFIFFQLIIIALMVLKPFSDVSAVPAFYKKKVQVQPFQNPPGWVGTYNPGSLISDLLQHKLAQQLNVNLVKFVNREPQIGKGNKGTSAQIIITGKIIKYRPALPVKLESTKTEKKMSHSAEAEIQFQIFQGQTRRLMTEFVINEKTFDGEFPLGYSQSSLNLKSSDFKDTFMGKVLSRMADQVIPEIVEYLDQIPLDGQVIAVEKEEEQMIINVGEKSGVEIRDEFTVYSVDVNYPDPLYHEDIGDRLTKMGVVRVINVQEGFAEAVIMAGGDFIKGNLVRSKKIKPLPKVLNNSAGTINFPLAR
jgi:hypothetical protein